MDRCRCPEYAAAVKKLRFYTPGTFRPDIIDNYDRGDYDVVWIRKPVTYGDATMYKPQAYKKRADGLTQEEILKIRNKKLEHMWCPYMLSKKK
ncbi:hypothetical protein SFRURICE_013139 [Spodoptera frugiperda]|uniref:SFRICE_022985 n=1 Tax=Spodoptera frugiperda TaxID=7108 RepID=A0A2H1VPJ9_SPOFR|nr:hypothetical protein SFRURICE_013139 [Spodoptera frugiperda]